MISIALPKTASPNTANVLPCKIKHTGPVNASSRHWNPDSTNTTSYFRGRKLIGTTVPLPESYSGHILTPSVTSKAGLAAPRSKSKPAYAGDDDDDEDDEDEEWTETTHWESLGEFEEAVIWGHEVASEAANDGIMRGLSEWMEFSAAINGFEPPKKRETAAQNEQGVEKGA